MSTLVSPIDTGIIFVDAVQSVVRVLDDYKTDLELRKVLNYDDLLINGDGIACVVFDRAIPIPKSLNNRCNRMDVSIIVYIYLESLNLGKASPRSLERLGMATQYLYDNRTLYGLCHSEPMIIGEASLIGRRLDSNVFLTGSINLTVPVRFSSEGN